MVTVVALGLSLQQLEHGGPQQQIGELAQGEQRGPAELLTRNPKLSHVCPHACKRAPRGHPVGWIAPEGYGVFATAVIPEGSFIVEYRGTLREARQCTPDPYSYYFIHNNTPYCIDALVDDGSLGRLVNDDSNPNSRMKIVSVCQVPHLCLFALRDIQPGEEITYDYGGYDLPWRRGTWLCTTSLTQLRNEEEGENVLCDERPSIPEPAEQTVSKEGEPTCTAEAPQARTQTEEEQQRICEDAFPQIQVTVQSNHNEEVISRNEEPPESQPASQVAHEEQMECEEQAFNSQSAEQLRDTVREGHLLLIALIHGHITGGKEVSEEQQTCMEAEPHLKEQSHTEATEQSYETSQLECKDDFLPVNEQGAAEEGAVVSQQEPSNRQTDEQMACEGEEKTCNKDSSQTQPAEQMDGKDAQQTCNEDSSQTAKPSSQTEQNSRLSNVDCSSDEEFIPDSDTDSENSSAHEKPVVPPNQNHLVTQATKQNFCFVCGKACSKISRHLKVHRQENFEIASAFKLRKSSKERRHILEVLRNRGNYKHNNRVFSKGSGVIKAKRKPKEDDIDTQKFEYCMYCKGLYMRKELWKHMRRCTSNPDRDTLKSTKTQVLGLAAMAQCKHLQHLSEDLKSVLCGMHQDEIAQVIRNDEFILRLAQDFLNKKGETKERRMLVRQTIRCIGKFLIVLQKKSSVRNLAEALKPLNFPKVVETVKEIAEFNEETNCFARPSVARRIGLILRKFCIITAEKAFAVHDRRLIDQTGVFFKLFNDARPHFALGEKKPVNLVFRNPPLLPFVKDVTVLHCYLEKASQRALRELKENPSAQSYADLSKVTLAQILMFNRRHGEVSQMTIGAFQERDKVQVPEDALTEFEKEFCTHYCRIEVKQKTEGRVTIILTPDMVTAVTLLIGQREQCGVCDTNVFVFGQPKSDRCYRGENAIRICAMESGAVNPEQLRSTAFSRHIATLTQVLSLKNQELKKLAKFIGHDISVRKEYYRQPEATARLAKLCKLILAIEKGNAANLLKESLDDIVVPDEIYESDSEDDFEEECTIFEQRRAKMLIAAQKMPKKRYTTPARTPATLCSAPTEVAQDKSPVQVEMKLYEHRRKFVKKPWTKEERAAVMKHFKKHIYQGKLALMAECQRCQMLEQPVLSRRTTQNIRDF
ncbi:hypothetical protein NFI96_016806, partial [Prochilodus magdalenae]